VSVLGGVSVEIICEGGLAVIYDRIHCFGVTTAVLL